MIVVIVLRVACVVVHIGDSENNSVMLLCMCGCVVVLIVCVV